MVSALGTGFTVEIESNMKVTGLRLVVLTAQLAFKSELNVLDVKLIEDSCISRVDEAVLVQCNNVLYDFFLKYLYI